MDCKLIQISSDKEQTFAIGEGSFTIGRGSDNDIQLLFDGISRCHAGLNNTSENCTLNDLNSLNGIYVNGKKTSSIALHHGDEIKIAGCILRFEMCRTGDSNNSAFVPRHFSNRSIYATVKMKHVPADSNRKQNQQKKKAVDQDHPRGFLRSLFRKH